MIGARFLGRADVTVAMAAEMTMSSVKTLGALNSWLETGKAAMLIYGMFRELEDVLSALVICSKGEHP